MKVLNEMELSALDVATRLLMQNTRLISIHTTSRLAGIYKEYITHYHELSIRCMVLVETDMESDEPITYAIERGNDGSWHAIEGTRSEIDYLIKHWAPWGVFYRLFGDAISFKDGYERVNKISDMSINLNKLSEIVYDYRRNQFSTSIQLYGVGGLPVNAKGLNLTEYSIEELRLQCYTINELADRDVDYILIPADNQLLAILEYLNLCLGRPELLYKQIITCAVGNRTGLLFKNITKVFVDIQDILKKI